MVNESISRAIQQLYPSLDPEKAQHWLAWALQQPDYYLARVGQAVCVVKVYDQVDPPWLRVAHEVAWWGHGRDAVRALHRGMAWARLRGATQFG